MPPMYEYCMMIRMQECLFNDGDDISPRECHIVCHEQCKKFKDKTSPPSRISDGD